MHIIDGIAIIIFIISTSLIIVTFVYPIHPNVKIFYDCYSHSNATGSVYPYMCE